MTANYTDRAFLSLNGIPIADIQSASVRKNHNARAVPTMTPDEFNRGFVQGNCDIDLNFTIAVQNTLARPKVDMIDYKANDVSITFQFGADLFVLSGIYKKTTSDDASGVGSEVKSSFEFGALKFTDAIGNAAALFDIDI